MAAGPVPAVITAGVAAEESAKSGAHTSIRATMRSGKVWLLGAIYFCVALGIYTVSFWLPSIISDSGVESPLTVGLLSAVPYLGAVVAMVAAAAHGDRTGERRWHTAIPCALAGLALILTAMSLGNTVLALLSLTLAAACGDGRRRSAGAAAPIGTGRRPHPRRRRLPPLRAQPGHFEEDDDAPSSGRTEAPRTRRRCLGHDEFVQLREGLSVEDSFLDGFAMRHGICRLALFGSTLRADFGPASDIDLLVEFQSGRTPGLLHLAQMELELEVAIGRRVELRTYEDLSRHFRDRVASTARPLYAA